MARSIKRVSRAVTDIDRRVGNKMKARRLELKLSQLDIAQALGVAPQQVQKYERGANRLSASRLYQLSIALDLRIDDFFEGCDLVKVSGPSEIERSLATPEGQRMAALFARIKSKKIRSSVFELAEVMVGQQ